MDVIETQCVYETDPPSVIVRINGWALGQFPIGDYNRIKGALGLPDVVCDGPK
jgi:hypothetical protein